MFKNYFRVAARNLLKQKGYSFINITVTGILQDVPRQSHVHFDLLASLPGVNRLMGWNVLDSNKSWHWPPMYTYILMRPGARPDAVESRFPELGLPFFNSVTQKNLSLFSAPNGDGARA